MKIATRLRTAARVLMGRSAYAAAKHPPNRAPWLPPQGGPNSANASGSRTIAARARDAVRNNAYAARIVDIWTANIVGTGITTRWSDPGHITAWSRWSTSTDCDAENTSDWSGIQVLAARAMVESGEALVWLRNAPRSGDNPVGLRLQVLEADRLDWTYTGTTDGGNRVVQGIEVDASGRPVAYWLIEDMDSFLLLRGNGMKRIRVPARDMIHLYRRRRPGQMRDVSWLAPVLWQMKDLTDYEAALLRKAYVEACVAMVVTGQDEDMVTGRPGEGTNPGVLRDGRNVPVESIEPQMILYRNGPGEVEVVNPSTGGSHVGFAKRTLEAEAVGTGLTYDQVSGDLSQANYSSLRAGKMEFRRLLEQVQYTVIVPLLCQRVASRFHANGAEAGLWPEIVDKPLHTPPAPEAVDPLKDTLALIAQVRAGFVPPQEAAAMFGTDFDTVLKMFREAHAAIDAAGEVFDTDPRRVAKSGSAQDPAQLAAIEIAATGASTGQ